MVFFLMMRRPPRTTLIPYTALFRSRRLHDVPVELAVEIGRTRMTIGQTLELRPGSVVSLNRLAGEPVDLLINGKDRKSTRLNSSHANISYAVFCLKKKTLSSVSPPP